MYFLCDPILFGGYLSTARTTKKTHLGKGCGWLASMSGSKYEIKRQIVAKDVVGLQLGDSKNNREFD
jgi:hypothetical protein